MRNLIDARSGATHRDRQRLRAGLERRTSGVDRAEQLAEAEERLRPRLFRELLELELELRRKRGDDPVADEYRARFPYQADTIEKVFAAAPATRRASRPRPAEEEDPRVGAAQNLLFGLLAFQHGFIDRDALLGAFNAWVADKRAAIGQRPARPRRPRRRPARLLAGLVAEHLEAARRRPGEEPGRPELGQRGGLRPPPPARRRRAGQRRSSRTHRSDPDAIASSAHFRRPPRGGAVPHSQAARRGRAGAGLRGRGRGARPRGGAKGDPAGARRRRREPRAFRARGRDHRRLGAPRHRAGLRPGPLRRRPPVLRDAVHRGRQPHARPSGDYHATKHPGPDPASTRSSATCCTGSSTSATRSPTPTAGACCTATSSRTTSCSATTARRWSSTGAWPRPPASRDAASGDRAEPTLIPPLGQRCRADPGGQAIGTPAYMSPEQARGDLYCARTTDGCVRTGGDPLPSAHR